MKTKSSPKKSNFKVSVTERGVEFQIDQQGFRLSIPSEDTPEEQKVAEEWYANQLRIALKRLKENG